MDSNQSKCVFLSGPFTAACEMVRSVIREIFPRQGITVLEKNGSVEESSAQLINEAAGILYVYGTEAAQIRDVWDRSLVVREFEYAAQLSKAAVVLLLGGDENIRHPETLRLRTHLRRQLREDVVCMTRVDDVGESYGRVGKLMAHVILAHADGRDLRAQLPKSWPAVVINGLADPKTARVTLARLFKDEQAPVPDYADVEDMIGVIDRLSRNWDRVARPVVTDQVFLSYSRKDLEVAERLTTFLADAGFNIWRDESRIGGGEPIKPALLQGISGSGAVLVLVSEHSAASRWVAEEVELAIGIQQKMGWINFVLPLRMNDTPEEAIEVLAGLNHFPLRSSECFVGDATAIADELDRPRRWHSEHDR